ncbi:response regulator receiver modulated metal dependent phosphohydrolase [Catenovulum agarivorans DS-2]|uniref:Response regulator receiver modulated metal dependent phosphohydrolase n=1 Tax=Catenovulum agarivorans DS-2 TaxID=1328313 RepID=W7QLR2_9ALTE|nr:HD domain-containing phosphohydrolase [Catenovulum agarivorans]EWH09877.1 response regulator receiver modulated metal dependent phosphohydrolase [Catenovulum agarivorans DS-2]
MSDNDLFEFAEDTITEQKETQYWKILVVDDDNFIHQVTGLVLNDLEIEGRKLQLLNAYSGSEAKAILQQEQDIALAFVDVVMETDHAGLDLVHWIRTELQNKSIRLILRTGQAGTAPEEQVIRDYDINDYKEKTELTARKLATCVFSGIRSYRDIVTIEKSLNGFQRLVSASTNILKTHSIIEFGSASLIQLFDLLEIECSSLYVAHTSTDKYTDDDKIILGATGNYVGYGHNYSSINISDKSKALIDSAFANKKTYIDENIYVGYYQTADLTESVLLAQFTQPVDEFHIRLLEIYATNIALVFENVTYREDLTTTQAELIYILGDAIEMRSKETGAHVKRVSLICHELASLYGCDEKFVSTLTHAAPLHDVGKIAIPEQILHKPGKLDAKEWSIMLRHAEIGGDLLKNSRKPITKAGAKIARHHHENWDGTGYPDGLIGEKIPLEARIVAIADVFDALGSRRSYKEPWSDDRIKALLKEESGKKFEPRLVDIMLENYELFTTIRELNPDEF